MSMAELIDGGVHAPSDSSESTISCNCEAVIHLTRILFLLFLLQQVSSGQDVSDDSITDILRQLDPLVDVASREVEILLETYQGIDPRVLSGLSEREKGHLDQLIDHLHWLRSQMQAGYYESVSRRVVTAALHIQGYGEVFGSQEAGKIVSDYKLLGADPQTVDVMRFVQRNIPRLESICDDAFVEGQS